MTGLMVVFDSEQRIWLNYLKSDYPDSGWIEITTNKWIRYISFEGVKLTMTNINQLQWEDYDSVCY